MNCNALMIACINVICVLYASAMQHNIMMTHQTAIAYAGNNEFVQMQYNAVVSIKNAIALITDAMISMQDFIARK